MIFSRSSIGQFNRRDFPLRRGTKGDVIIRHAINMLAIVLITVIIIIPLSCRKLPQAPDKPTNPLDPNNSNNSFHGSALVLSPSRVEVKANSRFDIELWVVESEPVAGVSTKIEFDAGKLQVSDSNILDKEENSFLLKNDGELISFQEINNSEGYLQLDLLVVEGSPRNVSGKGKIARITFEHIGGSAEIIAISDSSRLRNSQNLQVDINNFINAQIVVTGL
jgi:hypothetical protein